MDIVKHVIEPDDPWFPNPTEMYLAQNVKSAEIEKLRSVSFDCGEN